MKGCMMVGWLRLAGGGGGGGGGNGRLDPLVGVPRRGGGGGGGGGIMVQTHSMTIVVPVPLWGSLVIALQAHQRRPYDSA